MKTAISENSGNKTIVIPNAPKLPISLNKVSPIVVVAPEYVRIIPTVLEAIKISITPVISLKAFLNNLNNLLPGILNNHAIRITEKVKIVPSSINNHCPIITLLKKKEEKVFH